MSCDCCRGWWNEDAANPTGSAYGISAADRERLERQESSESSGIEEDDGESEDENVVENQVTIQVAPLDSLLRCTCLASQYLCLSHKQIISHISLTLSSLCLSLSRTHTYDLSLSLSLDLSLHAHKFVHARNHPLLERGGPNLRIVRDLNVKNDF